MASKGNFMDFIEDASTNDPLAVALLAEAYQPGETAEKLLTFFHSKSYFEVTLPDCYKLINATKAGPIPCTFGGGASY